MTQQETDWQLRATSKSIKITLRNRSEISQKQCCHKKWIINYWKHFRPILMNNNFFKLYLEVCTKAVFAIISKPEFKNKVCQFLDCWQRNTIWCYSEFELRKFFEKFLRAPQQTQNYNMTWFTFIQIRFHFYWWRTIKIPKAKNVKSLLIQIQTYLKFR